MNADLTKIVTDALLVPAGLNSEKIRSLLLTLHNAGIDYADFYFQHRQSESLLLEDGIVKDASFLIDQGVGVRTLCDSKTAFAYSDEINLSALEKSISAAKSIASNRQGKKVYISTDSSEQKSLSTQVEQLNQHINLYPISKNFLRNLTHEQKISLLKNIYEGITRLEPNVIHATINLAGSYEIILIAFGEGGLAADIRPMVRMDVNVVIAKGNKRERGRSGGGGRFSYDFYLKNDTALNYAREAVRIARVNLDAQHAPAGNMPVVLGSGWPGVLLHEAVGHGLEGDFNRKGTSVFSGRIGKRVATTVCNIVDNGSLAGGHRGSLNIDDEGTPTQCTLLIEKGILRSYMQDKLNAHLMGVQSTGNGRRESYASIPIPRMTNTYMLAGDSSPNDIISSVKKGIYAVNFSSGEVDITSGNFVFTTSEAYLIENGKVTRPIKEAALIGNGLDVLTKISMVGNDLALDPGIGTCGKEGQGVPVNVGQPTLKVDDLTVGGTGT